MTTERHTRACCLQHWEPAFIYTTAYVCPIEHPLCKQACALGTPLLLSSHDLGSKRVNHNQQMKFQVQSHEMRLQGQGHSPGCGQGPSVSAQQESDPL